MQTWEIVYHFDVWGNEEDGFTVNDSRSAGTVELPVNASDSQILRALNTGIVSWRVSDCIVSGTDTIEIDAPNGMPVLSLHLSND